MIRQQWLVFLPLTLATAGLAACASIMGGEGVQVHPVSTTPAQAAAQHDPLYESAVVAINDRDYGRALDYLQAMKAKDPRNVKALNALGVVYDKLGRFDLSARYYAQARAIEPDSKIVAENMGYSRVLAHSIGR
jgi:Flp pilus assembly protein TadD